MNVQHLPPMNERERERETEAQVQRCSLGGYAGNSQKAAARVDRFALFGGPKKPVLLQLRHACVTKIWTEVRICKIA